MKSGARRIKTKYPNRILIHWLCPVLPWSFACSLMLAIGLFCADNLSALPRSPQPPIPESGVLYSETFDAAYYAGQTNAEVVMPGLGTLEQSWSGYSLQRLGDVAGTGCRQWRSNRSRVVTASQRGRKYDESVGPIRRGAARGSASSDLLASRHLAQSGR